MRNRIERLTAASQWWAADNQGRPYSAFSDERLEQFMLNFSNESAQEILDKLVEDVKEFTKGAEQSDDITSLIIKVN